jgi:phytoene synthase
VREEELLRFEYSPQFQELARRVAARARHFYQRARQSLPPVDRRSMAAAELMGSVYWRLLKKLEARQFNVFGPTPTRLGRLQKLLLICRTWYRLSSGALVANYGVP